MQIYWETSRLKSPVSEKGLDQLLLWKKIALGSRNWFLGPIYPFY